MRPVGLGREPVDGYCVDGVLALLRALDVAVLAAPRTKEIALGPLAVRATAAAAFRDKRRACGDMRRPSGPDSARTPSPGFRPS